MTVRDQMLSANLSTRRTVRRPDQVLANARRSSAKATEEHTGVEHHAGVETATPSARFGDPGGGSSGKRINTGSVQPLAPFAKGR